LLRNEFCWPQGLFFRTARAGQGYARPYPCIQGVNGCALKTLPPFTFASLHSGQSGINYLSPRILSFGEGPRDKHAH
jgi:hypothetical protein